MHYQSVAIQTQFINGYIVDIDIDIDGGGDIDIDGGGDIDIDIDSGDISNDRGCLNR